MIQKPTVKPVLMRINQIEALRKIQEEERTKSPLGVAPTIHVIARGLMDKALAKLVRRHNGAITTFG